MVSAALCALVVVWRGEAAEVRQVVVPDGNVDLKRDLRAAAAERDALSRRVAEIERGLGEVKLALRADPDIATGSIERSTPPNQLPQAAPETTAPPQAAQTAASGSRPATQPRAEKPGGFAVALGAEASPDAARRRWSALAERHPQLGRLTPRMQRGAASDRIELLAGPFASRAEAERACVALAVQGLACDTTAYGGETLDRS